MDIEISYESTMHDHWIKLPKKIMDATRINLQDHLSASKPGERILIRANFPTFQGERKEWTASIPSKEEIILRTISDTSNQKIKLIYFLNCKLSQLYPKILKHHLKDIKRSGIDQCENFRVMFIVIGTHRDVKTIHRIAKKILPSIFDNQDTRITKPQNSRLEIRLFDNSHFEHQGIRALWSESHSSNNNDILIYAHCKHITQIDQTKKVSHHSKACSEIILRNLDTLTSLLNTFETIDRAGISQGETGWMWHNFFAAKARYLKKRPEPLLSDRRAYYESWLTGEARFEENYKAPEKNKGLSMLTPKGIAIGHITNANECNRLIYNYKLNSFSS